MSEAVLPAGNRQRHAARLPLSLTIGWRNLWRNGRRTALTAGGVAFAVFLVVVAMCIQLGSYRTMEETATSLLSGHLQVQNRRFLEDQHLEAALPRARDLMARIAAVPGVTAVAPRLETFALVSAGERSFGAKVMGIDPDAERQVVNFHERVFRGRYPAGGQDALLGEALARNLGVALGDEVVVLGNARRGGVAAMALEVTGLFRTGMAELDRSLLFAPVDAVATAFELEDQAHRLVIRTDDLDSVARTAAAVKRALPASWPQRTGGDGVPLVVRTWQEELPDLRQAIEIDRLSGALFYWIVMILVAFSVVNTFIMTVFERTREFGMLLAIGMRPRRIMLMLQWEAAFMWAMGAGAGLLLAAAVVGWLAHTGIYLGEDLERMASELYLPTRLYPAFTAEALLTAPAVMLLGTQLAAVLPSLRIRRIRPVDALRVAA